ncbi:MAG: transposase [Desulfobacterales bacterium]|jgi:hypothetical protein
MNDHQSVGRMEADRGGTQPLVDNRAYLHNYLIYCFILNALGVQAVLENGETKNDAIRPDFNKSIFIDFAGAKITSDAVFLMLREVNQRFDIIQSGSKLLKDTRSISHKTHSFEQMIRQRVYQIAAGYENCDNADLLRIDPALRLALDKGHQSGAGQSNGLSCDW